MLIDLDSSDIIRLERDAGLAAAFRDALAATASKLVLSEVVLDEISEPLRRRAEGSTVMSLLNLLESLPHVWIRTVDLERKEIDQGVRCFLAQEGYRPVDPFLDTFADTLLHLEADTAAYYRRQPLAAVVWDLMYAESITPARQSIRTRYPAVVQQDRDRIIGWTDREYRSRFQARFEEKVVGLLRNLRLDDRVDAAAFAAHVRGHTEWCPSTRLSFGVWHVLVYDSHSQPRDTDLDDLVRLLGLPYVDIFTCDGARRDQLRRLRQSERYGLRNWPYWETVRIAEGIRAVMELLVTQH